MSTKFTENLIKSKKLNDASKKVIKRCRSGISLTALNRFCTLFWCFHFLIWITKCRLGTLITISVIITHKSWFSVWYKDRNVNTSDDSRRYVRKQRKLNKKLQQQYQQQFEIG